MERDAMARLVGVNGFAMSVFHPCLSVAGFPPGARRFAKI
jgi:hypothetical protein